MGKAPSRQAGWASSGSGARLPGSASARARRVKISVRRGGMKALQVVGGKLFKALSFRFFEPPRKAADARQRCRAPHPCRLTCSRRPREPFGTKTDRSEERRRGKEG